MRFWRLVVADKSSGGVIAVLVSALLILHGLVVVVAADPAAQQSHSAFIHCITGSADEAGGQSKAPAPHDRCCLLCRSVSHAAVMPGGIALKLPASIEAIPDFADTIAALLSRRRARTMSEARAPPSSI